MHAFRGMITQSAFDDFPVGTWVEVQADGVAIEEPNGLIRLTGTESVSILTTESGIELNPDFAYGLAQSASGMLILIAQERGGPNNETLLVIDTTLRHVNFLRLVGGELQARGHDTERVRQAVFSGQKDAMVDAMIDDFFDTHRDADDNQDRLDRIYTWYTTLGGWTPCRMSC